MRNNTGSWQTVGMLAAQVLKYPREAKEPELKVREIMGEMRAAFARPENDLYRLLQVTRRRLLVAKPYKLNELMKQVAALQGPASPDEQWEPLSKKSLPRFARLTLGQLPIVRQTVEDGIQPALEQRAAQSMIRWAPRTSNEERFRTIVAGAVLLSALYGQIRNRLDLCKSCAILTVFPKRGFRRTYCDRCKDLARKRPMTASEQATGLPWWKVKPWRRVLGRMRRRGFKRSGLNTPKLKKQWRAKALRSLYELKSQDELAAWEQSVAPKGKPGRPLSQGRPPALSIREGVQPAGSGK